MNSPFDEGESRTKRVSESCSHLPGVLGVRDSGSQESLAKRCMELFSEAISTPEIFRITRENFSKFFGDETWFSNHIKSSLEQWLVPGESTSNSDSLYTVLGQDRYFDNVVMKMMPEILFNRLHYRETIEDKNNWHGQISNHVEETFGERIVGVVRGLNRKICLLSTILRLRSSSRSLSRRCYYCRKRAL